MSFRLVPKSVTLKAWMILNCVMAVILRYFSEFYSFRDVLHKND